jgi:HNH endonuclease
MDKHARAQERIAAGDWQVNAEAGQVYGRKGKPIGSRTWGGYTFLTLGPAPGERTNQNVYAHRVIWEHVHGRIPDGLQINHINGDKADNRLANLELVTGSENQRHAFRTGLKTQPGGEKHHRARLTAAQVQAIRARYQAGERQAALAAEYGVCRAHIGSIVRGERWAS